MGSKYSISVRKVGRSFVLFNHEAVAGARLYKGESTKSPKCFWPFRDDNWRIHKTKEAAESAAQLLQTYLDKRDKALS